MTERDFIATAARYGKNSVRINAHTVYSVGHKYDTPTIAGYGPQTGVREIARNLTLDEAMEIAETFGQSMKECEVAGFTLDVQKYEVDAPGGERLQPLLQALQGLPYGAQVSFKMEAGGARVIQTWLTPKTIQVREEAAKADPSVRDLEAAKARVASHITTETTHASILDIMAKEFGDWHWPTQDYLVGVCEAMERAWGKDRREMERLLDNYRERRRQTLIGNLTEDADLPDIIRVCDRLLDMRPSSSYIRKHIHAIADRTGRAPETIEKCFAALTSAADAKAQAVNEHDAAQKGIEIVSRLNTATPLETVRAEVMVMGTIAHISRATLNTLVGILATTTTCHLSELSAWAFSDKRWSA
ncbi:hypothetical protein BAJUN_01520 [Bajunvirus bajun]|uniref:Uncharacterized protein n=1 Tax=Brevundimonas phage vB_BgoS-Bajun TaxID=2948594 RepID=A0A9E7SUU3_9CAUD|nr:hypothetical protein BAJUN_01520 [Brevundimonas phage vB_BgoS-Bajun]